MRLPSIHEPEESNSMSAMTDVVFLLLIFFIVTMSGYVEMTLLETNLPTASGKISDKVDLQESLTIELSSDGQTNSADSGVFESSFQPIQSSHAQG